MISSCLYAYRNAFHETIGETPFHLMSLRDSYMTIHLELVKPISQYVEEPNYKSCKNE